MCEKRERELNDNLVTANRNETKKLLTECRSVFSRLRENLIYILSFMCDSNESLARNSRERLHFKIQLWLSQTLSKK
jgi:hypothetical protein